RAFALAVGTMLGAVSSSGWAAEKFDRGFLDKQGEEIEVFIRLATPSVSELNAASLAATGAMASRAAQVEQARRVDAEQAAFRSNLGSYNATELSRQRVGANGFRVSVPAGQVEALKALPGVISIGRVEKHEIDNVESVPWIGAVRAATELGLRGDGIKIGIIDTGIDYTHANFGGPGTVAAFNANDKNIIEAGTFPTAKVKGGTDFAGPTYNANVAGSVPAPDPDPLDGNGHGSHVAGSAAGFGVASSIGAGVAPNAELYALKVFSDGGGSTNLTSLAIEWAMDPNADGDMSDHLDVINMSLGSPFGEPADPSAISSSNAAAVGIIVVASAGNESNVPYITGAPAVSPEAISVAANVPGGRNFATVNVTAPAAVAGAKFNEEGTSPSRVSAVAPLSDIVVEADPLLGCGPLANAAEVSGNIVLMQRGVCTFQLKSANARAAGARAVIMVNSVAGDPITMGAITALIPGVMISLESGTPIISQATTAAATTPVQVTLGFGPDATKQDRIAGFSSRGPGHTGSGFKPDLSAPGVGIVSTGRGTGTGSLNIQGTSMAAPHVAGAAALLRELHPKLSVSGIKALLQNSTEDGNASGDTSLARHGVGAVRVDRAARLTSFASPGGVSFGRVNPDETTTVEREVRLTNMSNRNRTFSVTHVPRATYPGVTVSCPKSVKVDKRDSEELELRLRFDPSATAAANVFDNASVSQSEVDGWCVLSDGTDTLRVGYLAAVDAASDLELDAKGASGIRIENDGPAVGFAEGFTFVASGGTGADRTYSSIKHLGVRTGMLAGFPIMELGIAVDRRYEHVSNLDIDMFLDVDGNGTDDVRLAARDRSAFQNVAPGTYAVAQFIVGGGGFLDWINLGGWDFNDSVLMLPFTLEAGGGLVPDSFTYRLVLSDRQGNTDVQTGSINLANEIVPDLNGFGLANDESVNIANTGPKGKVLWLFPNNREKDQAAVATLGSDDDDE
ncbi:MAG: S8 family serine peptidase, partial [Gammaproteobacteria bacterium]